MRKNGPLAGITTLLTEELIKKFCRYIRRGMPVDGVCDYLCISYQAFHNWRDKGEKYLLGDSQPREHALYGLFAMKLRRAMAKYRYKRIKKLHSGGPGIWVREMTILERRDRRNFSRDDPQGGNDQDWTPDERYL